MRSGIIYSHHENQQPVIFQYMLEALKNGNFSKKKTKNKTYHQMHCVIKIEIVIKMASSLSAGNILSP